MSTLHLKSFLPTRTFWPMMKFRRNFLILWWGTMTALCSAAIDVSLKQTNLQNTYKLLEWKHPSRNELGAWGRPFEIEGGGIVSVSLHSHLVAPIFIKAYPHSLPVFFYGCLASRSGWGVELLGERSPVQTPASCTIGNPNLWQTSARAKASPSCTIYIYIYIWWGKQKTYFTNILLVPLTIQ